MPVPSPVRAQRPVLEITERLLAPTHAAVGSKELEFLTMNQIVYGGIVKNEDPETGQTTLQIQLLGNANSGVFSNIALVDQEKLSPAVLQRLERMVRPWWWAQETVFPENGYEVGWGDWMLARDLRRMQTKMRQFSKDGAGIYYYNRCCAKFSSKISPFENNQDCWFHIIVEPETSRRILRFIAVDATQIPGSKARDCDQGQSAICGIGRKTYAVSQGLVLARNSAFTLLPDALPKTMTRFQQLIDDCIAEGGSNSFMEILDIPIDMFLADIGHSAPLVDSGDNTELTKPQLSPTLERRSLYHMSDESFERLLVEESQPFSRGRCMVWSPGTNNAFELSVPGNMTLQQMKFVYGSSLYEYFYSLLWDFMLDKHMYNYEYNIMNLVANLKLDARAPEVGNFLRKIFCFPYQVNHRTQIRYSLHYLSKRAYDSAECIDKIHYVEALMRSRFSWNFELFGVDENNGGSVRILQEILAYAVQKNNMLELTAMLQKMDALSNETQQRLDNDEDAFVSEDMSVTSFGKSITESSSILKAVVMADMMNMSNVANSDIDKYWMASASSPQTSSLFGTVIKAVGKGLFYILKGIFIGAFFIIFGVGLLLLKANFTS
jgi:hypothetical protein